MNEPTPNQTPVIGAVSLGCSSCASLRVEVEQLTSELVAAMYEVERLEKAVELARQELAEGRTTMKALMGLEEAFEDLHGKTD